MGDQVFISWNIANWVTVVLMVALGYLLATLVAQYAFKGGFGVPSGSRNLADQLTAG